MQFRDCHRLTDTTDASFKLTRTIYGMEMFAFLSIFHKKIGGAFIREGAFTYNTACQ